jgi:hypothetical protein
MRISAFQYSQQSTPKPVDWAPLVSMETTSSHHRVGQMRDTNRLGENTCWVGNGWAREDSNSRPFESNPRGTINSMYWRKIGDCDFHRPLSTNNLLKSLALPRGLRQYCNFNHLAESGTPDRSIELHSFLAKVSHRSTARRALTVIATPAPCPDAFRYNAPAESE